MKQQRIRLEALAGNPEPYSGVKDSPRLPSGGEEPSLMSKLKSIKIEGPEDFAANHDQYVTGERRAKPDLP
ncbi:MAG TPA: hypothetical protein VE685_25780 [Thermoanaerobaculia bacterium]|nr:hypothetical protein [Thermoanaerobaculia bacterium]